MTECGFYLKISAKTISICVQTGGVYSAFLHLNFSLTKPKQSLYSLHTAMLCGVMYTFPQKYNLKTCMMMTECVLLPSNSAKTI